MTRQVAEQRRSAGSRALGTAGGAVLVLVGVGCLLMALTTFWGVRSAMHPQFRPAAVHSSSDGPSVRLESGDYGLTSMETPLEGCSVVNRDGARITVRRDEAISHRPVFRFQAPTSDYSISCLPTDAWFQVYRGDDVAKAAQGFAGPIHPSLYWLLGALPPLLLGNHLWQRSSRRP